MLIQKGLNSFLFIFRLKLFYWNEGKYCDRGIGNLYLKPNSKGDKIQLIIRADTTLSQLLLNVVLNEHLPISKLNDKNISFMCVPNPSIPGIKEPEKPCNFLFKVKTNEDADELLNKLNELKK
jgi:nuclear pore complex protein Nup50